MICPICGKELKLNEMFYELPFVGKVYIYSFVCECGYKKSDIELLEIKEPVRMKVTVEKEEDLFIKIIRSRTGKITLEEVGIEILPGPAAEFFITNIEGLIYKVLDVLEMAKRFREEENDIEGVKRCEEIKEYLLKVLEGKNKLTVIIEDEFGNSYILSEKAIKF